MEGEALQQRLFQVKAEFQSQIGEYKKLLDMRAARIHKCKCEHILFVLLCSDQGFQRYSFNSIPACSILHGGLHRNALREQLSIPIPWAQRVSGCVHLQSAFRRGLVRTHEGFCRAEMEP